MGLSFLVAMLALLGIALLYQRIFALDSACTPLCAVSSIGIVQYGAVLFGHLQLATMLVQGLGISVLLILSIRYFGRAHQRKQLLQSVHDYSALGIYMFILLFCFCYSVDAPMFRNDVYVFWGAAGKYIFLTHALPGADSALLPVHLTYTFGTALFHYFFAVYANLYYPSLAYTAQYALWIAALALVMYQKKSWNAGIAFIFALLVLRLCDNSFLMNLMVDVPISLYFFAILFIIFAEEKPLQRHLAILPPIVFLPLLKLIGFYFGIIGLIAALIVWCYEYKFNPLLKKRSWYELLPLLVAVLGLLSVYLSWSWRNEYLGFQDSFISPINATSVTRLMFSSSPDEVYIRYTILKELLLSLQGGIFLPFIVWFFLLGFGFIVLAKTRPKEEARKIYLLSSIAFIALFIYLFMLFLFEGITFASVVLDQHGGAAEERYSMICVTPIVFFLYACIVKNKLLHHSKVGVRFAIMVVILFILALTVAYKGYHTMTPSLLEAVNNVKQVSPELLQDKSALVCILESYSDRDHAEIYRNLAYHYELVLHKIIYLPSDASKALKSACNIVLVDQSRP